MRNLIPVRPRRKPSEEGYILVVVIFMLAILMIALTVAAPIVKKDIQRDRELETMHRGKQYARAVKLYYKKFGTYPPNVDALVKTNQIRFLRKKYIDPTTGKDEWKIIHFGEQKTEPMGFFGQPLAGAGSTLAGTGPMGGPTGVGSGLGSSFGSSTGSSFGSTDSGTGATANPGTAASGMSGSSTDASNNGTGSSGSSSGSSATGSSSTTGGSSSTSTGTGGTGTGLTGQTFGGGVVIGFSPNSPKQSILVYKKKNHYNEWEFIYNPLTDHMMQGGNAGAIGQPIGNTTTPIGSSGIGGNSGFGNSAGGTNFGGNGSGTTQGSTPATPQPTPQQ
jgi:type II secretory pathway pseudopilin PulG